MDTIDNEVGPSGSNLVSIISIIERVGSGGPGGGRGKHALRKNHNAKQRILNN